MRPIILATTAVTLLMGCGDDAIQPPDSGTDLAAVDSGVDLTGAADGPVDANPTDTHGGDSKPADAAADSSPVDNMTADKGAHPLDGTSSFPGVLTGIWLVGWHGGLEHFSWVKFGKASSIGGGDAWILDGKAIKINSPYWSCSGKTSWNLASKPSTVQLHFPSSTCHPQGLKSAAYTFTSFVAPGSYPYGPILKATVTPNPGTAVIGYKFPASQCNAGMTTCKSPF